MTQQDRQIDWSNDSTLTVLRKIHASDSFPGVLDTVGNSEVYLYGASEESILRGQPGEILARRGPAFCRATIDGAVWISHARRRKHGTESFFKLPATLVLSEELANVSEREAPRLMDGRVPGTFQDIFYEEKNDVGYLHFPFQDGAMSTEQCRRLREAFCQVRQRATKAIVLMGGEDFAANGIHLGVIEAAESPAQESWENINAMNDLVHDILNTTSHFVVSALRGNAAAGGVFLLLAADLVVARDGVILNPHYRNMGNLFGSEYWTYVLPRRVNLEWQGWLQKNRLPLGVREAQACGLADLVLNEQGEAFLGRLASVIEEQISRPDFSQVLEKKAQQRAADELKKPLAHYRQEELEKMRCNFFGFDPSYHVARFNFIRRVPHSRTPFYLAKHR